MIEFSIITAKRPAMISKSFHLEDGQLTKMSGGHLLEGFIEKVTVADIQEMARVLGTLTPVQAITWGVSEHPKARVVTKKELKKNGRGNGGMPVIARDREHLIWPKHATWMIDYDPGKNKPLHIESLLEILYETISELKEAPHLARPSASSFIYHGDEKLRGACGWRILIPVQNGSDIKRAGEILFKKLWLSGHGHIEISKSGSKIVRCVVDDSVWQPERLDFQGGAHCRPPLTQQFPDPIIRNEKAVLFDTSTIQITHEEESEYYELVETAKKNAEPDAAETRRTWIELRVENAMQAPEVAKLAPEHRAKKRQTFKERFRQAVTNCVLLGDFELITEQGEQIKVGQILDDPDKYHNTRFHDPLEPDYQNDSRIAWANLRCSGRPYIYSHAHGGKRYTLCRARKEIELVAGERYAIVERALELARIDGALYERGGELIRITDTGEIIPQDAGRMQLYLDRIARWTKYDKRSDALKPVDVPPTVANGVIAMKGEWHMPTLIGIVTAPVMDLSDGRIIEQDGYDRRTGLLLILHEDDWPGVPARPTLDDLRDAMRTLWIPFARFPFDNSKSRGVFLNAILTACVRQALETAPGTLIDAPVSGSGKTLLARSLAIMAGTTRPAVLPLPGGRDSSEEIRKRLLARGREGHHCLIMDNVVGILESDALCAWLTSEWYADRILGGSETITIPTRSLLIATGNNVILKGDLCRRILICRIDPRMERPWKRNFDLNPTQYCQENRLKMASAALTVLRIARQDGNRPPDRTASFETWSDTIRAAVRYAGAAAVLSDDDGNVVEFADPVDSIDDSYDMDPETQKLSSLLAAIYARKKNEKWIVAEIVKIANWDPEGELYSAVYEICGSSGALNSRILGRWLERQSGRTLNSKSFERSSRIAAGQQWIVKDAQ